MIEVEVGDTIVEFPDGTAPEVMRAALQKRFGGGQGANTEAKADREVSAPDVASDVAQSAATGLRSGVESLVGIPGDLGELVRTIGGAGLDLLQENNVITPETRRKIEVAGEIAGRASPGAALVAQGPTSEDIRSVTNTVFGEPREPETTAGEFAKTVGEFAPAAIAGPGSLAGRAAVAGTAAIASEAAGQATEDTDLEPFARLAGGLLGGGAAAIRQFNRQALKSLGEVPTRAQLATNVRQMYKELTDAQIGFDVNSVRRELTVLGRALDRRALSEVSAPKASGYVRELGEQIDRLDFNRLEAFRKNIGNDIRAIAKQQDPGRPGDKVALEMIRGGIDRIMTNAKAVSATGSPIANEVGKTVKIAREMARRKIKSDQIEEAIEIAKTRRSDFQTAISNELTKLIRGRRANQWTKAEREAIKLAAEGRAGRKALKSLSKFGVDLTDLGSPASLVPGVGFGVGTALDGVGTGGAVVLGGTGARMLGNRLARGATDQAAQISRAGIPGQQRLEQLTPSSVQLRVQQLLLGEAAARSARNNQAP